MADINYATATQAKRDSNPDSFASVAEQADGLAGTFLRRLEALTDRLCGGMPPSPEGSATGQLRGLPNGYFDEAADHARSVMSKLELADRCLDRIERALP